MGDSLNITPGEYKRRLLADKDYLYQFAAGTFLTAPFVFTSTLLVSIGLQQKVFKKYLPYKLTHQYFLIPPVCIALSTTVGLALHLQRLARREYVKNMGYKKDADGVLRKMV